MSTTNILDLNNRIDDLEKNSGGGGSADSAKRSDIATEFSVTTAYTAGCFVYYEGKLYQFNADHAEGAWDPTDVVEANVTDQIVSNASAIAGLSASDVAYDNTASGLSATNVKGALDELADSYPAGNVMLSDGVTSVEDIVSYSSSERVIGEWVNGKTLYEYYIPFTNVTSTTSYDLPSGVDEIIGINGMYTVGYNTIPLPVSQYTSATPPALAGQVRLYSTNNTTPKSITLYVYNNTLNSGFILIKYTKTN